uniref:Transglycosylase SLT domain-containing protein n=1 Tax=Neobacillus citreus TaxID=2833578 RepID=A0A942T0K4_9BACI
MGRHTADHSSDRDPREHLDRPVVGERRAALNRTRDTDAPQTAPVAIAPKSVADNRVSDATLAYAAPATPADPRVVKQRRARAVAVPAKPTAVRGANAFMRKRATIPALSFFAVFGILGSSLINPLQADVAQAAVSAPVLTKAPAKPQQYTAHGTYAAFDTSRDAYGVTVPKPKVTAAPKAEESDEDSDDASTESTTVSATNTLAAVAAAPDPGSAQAIALQMVTARGWGTDQYNCLVSLWNKESGWRVDAYNPSGAYGIPQALPGSKMATAGADWQTNPATQITWGLNYISGVYGTPCGAWGHSQSYNWY